MNSGGSASATSTKLAQMLSRTLAGARGEKDGMRARGVRQLTLGAWCRTYSAADPERIPLKAEKLMPDEAVVNSIASVAAVIARAQLRVRRIRR
jgi:hypothetical protein